MSTTVRLPLRLEQTLAAYCAETRRSKSEVIIEALERRFSEALPEKTAYAAAIEAGFIGAFASSAESPAAIVCGRRHWSATPSPSPSRSSCAGA